MAKSRLSLRVVMTLLFAGLYSPAVSQRHPAPAQKPLTLSDNHTSGSFDFGMTPEEVNTRLGKPTNHFYHYRRKTTSNEYDLNLDFGSDDSESRLHPVYRLVGAKIVVDRPISAMAILSDIPEAKALCAKGCSLLGIISDFSFNYEPHIIVYPTDPTAEQSRIGTLIGTQWRPDEAKAPWVPAIVLHWTTQMDMTYPAPDWMNQHIETVTFTAICPSVEEVRGIHPKQLTHVPDHPPVKLSQWTPSS